MTTPALRDALATFIYETTCLSPLNDDGSHDCRISAECLEAGREALRNTREGGIEGRAEAEALCLARKHLEKLGWKYSAADIGKTARKILDGMQSDTDKESG